MQFYLKHAVGNRERWKTRGTLSHASGVIIAEELTKVPGVTGLEVNPLTGSVTLTVEDVATKARSPARFGRNVPRGLAPAGSRRPDFLCDRAGFHQHAGAPRLFESP